MQNSNFEPTEQTCHKLVGVFFVVFPMTYFNIIKKMGKSHEKITSDEKISCFGLGNVDI